MLLIATLMGCKVVDAPEDLEALMVYGFTYFGDEDERYLQETADSLLPILARDAESLADGNRINDLTAADLEQAGVTAPIESGIVGAVGLVEYRHDVVDILDVVSHPDKAAMFPDNFLEYVVQQSTDRPCFLSEECPTLDQTIFEKTKIVLLGEGERTYDSSYRWITAEEAGRVAFIRQIAPEEMKFSSGIAVVNQQYSFVMLYEDGGVAHRVEAFWVDAEVIGMDVPDSYSVDQAVNAMSDQAARVDDWLDANPLR